MARPNILYIHGHDTGRYVQPYGHAVATPNIQKLAEEGVLFRKAFCAAPTCSPSRSALLTGQAPHNAGMVGLVNRGYDLSDHSQHIVTTLRHAGYHTVRTFASGSRQVRLLVFSCHGENRNQRERLRGIPAVDVR